MAYAQVIGGFEGASGAGWTLAAASVITAAKRSGSYGLLTNPAGGSSMGRMSINQAITMGSPPGEVFGAYHEVFFKINTLPTAANTAIGQFGAGSTPGIQLEVSTDGTWQIVVTGIGTVTGGSALPTGVWLRLIAKHWSYPAAGQDQFGTQASPTHAQKARLEIDSEDGLTNYGRLSTTGANLSVFGLDGPICGARAPNVGTFDIIWDDAKCLVATNITDVYVITKWLVGGAGSIHKLNDNGSIFTKTKVLLAVPRAQGASDQFTPAGAFADVAEVPKGTGSVSSSTLDNTTTYVPTTWVSSQTVEALTLRANAAGAAQPHALMLDGVEYAKTLQSTSDDDNENTPLASLVYFTPITHTTFNALQFGVRVKTGGSTVTLENIFLEVLSDDPEVLFTNADTTIGLTWVERLDSALVTHVSAKIALPDPLTYFFGFKKATVIKWGRIRRALSDRNGQYEGTDFSWIESDVDRFIRSQLAAESTKYFVNQPFTVRMIADPDRRLLKLPRTVVKGIIRDYRPLSPLHFEFTGQDILAAKFSPSNDKDQIPQRTITVTDFAQAAAEYTPVGDSVPTKVDAVDLPVPIIYGNVNNIQNTTVVTITGGGTTQQLVLDTTIPKGQQVAMHGQTSVPGTFVKDERIHSTMTVIKNGKEGPHGNYSGNTNSGYADGSGTDGSFSGSWDREPSADGYRIYMFPSYVPGGFDPANPRNDAPGKIRFIFHDNNPATQDGFYGHKYGVVFSGWDDPDWTDFFTGPSVPATTTSAILDKGTGPVGAIYVGQETISSVLHHAFLICGHAVKSIDEIYVNKVAIKVATSRGPWKVPGYDGRPKFEDRNGRRYAVLYGQVGFEGPDTCAANINALGLAVQGIETVGDGSGTLITSFLAQYKHAVINWILQSYQSGAWLSAPVFPDDAALSQIDTASFDAADATSQLRISGGYVGAFVIGHQGETFTVRDLVALFNINGDVDSGFNRKTQFFVSMATESVTALAASDRLTDVTDIFSGSFDIEDLVWELFNRYEYQYGRNYTAQAGDPPWLNESSIEDAVSITKHKETKIAPKVVFELVRDSVTAQDVIMRKLMRTKTPPRIIKLQTGLRGVNYELGDLLRLSHYEGVASVGWTDRPVRILRHETDPDDYSVSLECVDMGFMFGSAQDGGGGPFIFGNESVLTTWGAASLAQKVYGFLSNETTGLFGDGAEGKHLR